MAASDGNKYAEKWDRDSAFEKIKEVHQATVTNKYPFIGHALVDVGLYKDLWQYWKDKFSDDDEVFRLIKITESVIESNLVKDAFDSKNPTIHIFTLKNHHGWEDKVKQEIKNQTVTFLDD